MLSLSSSPLVSERNGDPSRECCNIQLDIHSRLLLGRYYTAQAPKGTPRGLGRNTP